MPRVHDALVVELDWSQVVRAEGKASIRKMDFMARKPSRRGVRGARQFGFGTTRRTYIGRSAISAKRSQTRTRKTSTTDTGKKRRLEDEDGRKWGGSDIPRKRRKTWLETRVSSNKPFT